MTIVQTDVAVTLLVAVAIAIGVTGSAYARTPYDGVWSVVVAAEAGTCSGACRYPVAIANGYVRQVEPADQSLDIQGRVSRGGHVNVQVSRGDQRAYGVGRLAHSAGGGTWCSPNGCAGHWVATRRD
jgi:hypothetical protein